MVDLQKILKLFEKNQIYFCEEYGDTSTNTVKQMLKCFEIFQPFGTYALFYRLKKKCRQMGYIDKCDLLIQPDKQYKNMVSLALLDVPIECPSWVEEEEFEDYLANDQLLQLVQEISISSQLKQNITHYQQLDKQLNEDYIYESIESSEASEESSGLGEDITIGNLKFDSVDRVLNQEDSPLYTYTSSDTNSNNNNNNSSSSNSNNSNSNNSNSNNSDNSSSNNSDSREIIEIVIEESSTEEDISSENFIPGYSDSSE